MSGRSWLFKAFLIIYLTFSLIACSSGTPSPSSTSRQASPTPTALPKGTVLYQADWSHGLADWQPSGGWKAIKGYVQSAADSNASITAPYKPTVPNYAIEARIQLVKVQENGGSFYISAEKAPGKDGYRATVYGLLKPGSYIFGLHPTISALIDPLDSMGDATPDPHDYEPGSSWHTYRIEVQGPQVTFFVDNIPDSHATSMNTQSLSNGPISLQVSDVIVQVSSFRITVL